MPDLAHQTRTEAELGRPRHTDEVVAQLARAQFGMVATWQLLAGGLTKDEIYWRMKRERWVRVYRGVYAAGLLPVIGNARLMAAVLLCGEGAGLSHRTAGGRWSVSAAGTIIDVTCPRGAARSRKGLFVHGVRNLDPADMVVRDGIRTTSLARTLVDLADVLPAHRLLKAVNEAERIHQIDVAEIHAVMRRTRGRHGHPLLAAAVRELATHGTVITRSDFEDALRQLVVDSDIDRPTYNALVGPYTVDAFWPDIKLVVELDSYEFHKDARTFAADRKRDRTLRSWGYHPERFVYEEVVRNPHNAATELRQILARHSDQG